MDSGKVTKVRVFIDRAAITRARALPEPAKEIVFDPIPLDADTATLRASAELGGTSLRVTGVVWSVIYAELASKRQKEIKAELEKLDEKLKALEDAGSADTHQVNLLQRYAQTATQLISREWMDKDPSFDKWGATFDHLRQRNAALSAGRAARQMERQEIQKAQADLLQEDYRIGHPEQLGYRVTVSLELPANARGPLSVELTYITKKAQWMPTYDARHQPAGAAGSAGDGKERMTLTGVALVRQATGEDWEEIELIATTARPPLSEPPPELTQLIVVGHQGGEQREVVSTTRESARLSGAGGRPPPGAGEKEMTVEHRAPGKVSVPSTNHPVRVELFSSELPCRARLEVAPRERPVAILVADLENRTGRVLLPGKINIFRGPNYSGQSRLGFVTPNERFRVALGTEGGLRIKREVNAHPEKKGAITGAVTHLFESRTVLENLGNSAIDVLLRDRVPVSRSEDATVKVTEMDRAMEIQAETGLTSLPLTIAPHSKREVSLAYKITAPRGFRITPPRLV